MASDNKWTKGKWEVVRYGNGDSLVIHSDSETRVCFMATPGELGDPNAIAANAALIAAAPTMAEAAVAIDRLMLVIESAVRNADPSHHRAVVDALNANAAALRKARGE